LDTGSKGLEEIWSPQDFQKHGQDVLRWVAEFLGHPERHPVLSKARPGDIRGALPSRPPNKPQPMDAILRDFESLIVPGMTHWNHPGFMAYFGITGSMPGILAETLSAALNVNGMLWKTSPAATELEQVTLDWLRQLLGLPPAFWGVIQDTASVSSLVALVAARQSIPGVRDEGMAGREDLPPLRIYISEQAHVSIEKAGIVIGVGRRGVRKVPTDRNYRMDTRALEKLIQEDVAEGNRPFAVVATAGTTSTTSVDPMDRIAEVCRRYKIWLHVDAAYAGSAAILPEKRRLFRGWEKADSIIVNPHKWLFCPIDLSALYFRDPKILKEALSLVPDYLKTREDPLVTNYMDYGIALGRRFRALKLWFVLRAYGKAGIQERLRKHIRLARSFARWVDKSLLFERKAPVPFSTICFRLAPEERKIPKDQLNRINERLLDRVNARGDVFLSSTHLRGETILRLTIGNIRTTRAWVARAREILEEESKALLG
jgi:aromatic-L-amino-acid decarboxylase